jgi:hypothetical protein
VLQHSRETIGLLKQANQRTAKQSPNQKQIAEKHKNKGTAKKAKRQTQHLLSTQPFLKRVSHPKIQTSLFQE